MHYANLSCSSFHRILQGPGPPRGRPLPLHLQGVDTAGHMQTVLCGMTVSHTLSVTFSSFGSWWKMFLNLHYMWNDSTPAQQCFCRAVKWILSQWCERMCSISKSDPCCSYKRECVIVFNMQQLFVNVKFWRSPLHQRDSVVSVKHVKPDVNTQAALNLWATSERSNQITLTTWSTACMQGFTVPRLPNSH